MTWDEAVFDVLEDLEGEAVGRFAVERDAELLDRRRAEYATVSLASRLMASVGAEVSLEVSGAGRLSGILRRVGSGWCVLRPGHGSHTWLVVLDAVETAVGLSGRGVPEVAWPPVARLGLGAGLRRLADEGAPCLVVTRSGARLPMVLHRVGRDFVEGRAPLEGAVEGAADQPVVVACAALAALGSEG